MMLSYLSLLTGALAAMPVYILNSDAVAPAEFTLDASHFGAVVAHFLGANQLASQEAIDAAQFVPGTFMDSRSSNVVILTDFDVASASDKLGSALFEVTPSDSPKHVDVSTPVGGAAALDAVKSLDTKDSETLLLKAQGEQSELIDALLDLKSKVLILGVPYGKAVPVFRTVEKVTTQSSSKHKPKPKRGAAPFDSLKECTSNTNNCTGNGVCAKTSRGYECICKASTKKGYTTYWGGSACEKRDVSWQFNLLFWTGTGLIVAIIAGVSMLFSIGSDPLPGILNVQ